MSVNVDCTNTTRFPHDFASITGGSGNQASSTSSSVTGGELNLAGDQFSDVMGGCKNVTGSGTTPSTSCSLVATTRSCPGYSNQAYGGQSAVLAGDDNSAAD